MKGKKIFTLALSIATAASLLTGCSKTQNVSTAPVEEVTVPEIEGYTLLWHDEFSADTMDESIWSYDPHEPGWTNNELQE